MSDLINKVGGIDKAREIVFFAPSDCDAYETIDHVFELDELRQAIADHDRTDFCNNFENGLSPNTKVIEK